MQPGKKQNKQRKTGGFLFIYLFIYAKKARDNPRLQSQRTDTQNLDTDISLEYTSNISLSTRPDTSRPLTDSTTGVALNMAEADDHLTRGAIVNTTTDRMFDYAVADLLK